MEMETVNIPLGAAGSLRSRVCGRPGVAPFPSSMLYPSDAFELVSAHPYLAGTSPNAHFLAGLNKIKCYYDLEESKWAQTSPPFIVWVPSRDTFDANQVPQVKLVRNGVLESIEAIERCQSGFNIHLFTKRTSDLACYREMWALLSRLRLAMRYALNTTANYRTDSGGYDQKRESYPNMLHYTLGVAPYVPVVDVPDVLATVETLVTETVLPLAP